MISTIVLLTLSGAMLIGALVAFARWRADPDNDLGMSYKWASLIPVAIVMTPTIVAFYKATYNCQPQCDDMTGPITLVGGLFLSVFVAAAGAVGAFLAIERLSK